MALPISPEYRTHNSVEAPAITSESLYDKFKKARQSAPSFARSKIYIPQTRQQEISTGVWNGILKDAAPLVGSFIIGTGILVAIAHSISHYNPEIMNMRVEDKSQVDKAAENNAWRSRYNKPTPLQQLIQSGSPTPLPADLLPSKTARFAEQQVMVPIPYSPNDEVAYPVASPVASPLPSPTFQPTPVIDAGGNFMGEQVNAGGR